MQAFYIVPNDDQWNACAVSWINKPLNMLATALASVRCCSVQSLSIVVWCYPLAVLQRNLTRFWCVPLWTSSAASITSTSLWQNKLLCIYIIVLQKIGNQTRNRLTECNLEMMVKRSHSVIILHVSPFYWYSKQRTYKSNIYHHVYMILRPSHFVRQIIHKWTSHTVNVFL